MRPGRGWRIPHGSSAIAGGPAWRAHSPKACAPSACAGAATLALAKTGLQQVCTAAAINVSRVVHWLNGRPRAKTRVTRFASLGQHLLKVAVADRKLKVPAHGPEDHVRREAEAAEHPGS